MDKTCETCDRFDDCDGSYADDNGLCDAYWNQNSRLAELKQQIKSLKERLDQYEEDCGECGGSGMLKTGIYNEEPCPKCDNTGKQRVYVLENEFVEILKSRKLYVGWKPDKEVIIYKKMGLGSDGHVFKLTRLPDKHWKLEGVE